MKENKYAVAAKGSKKAISKPKDFQKLAVTLKKGGK